jgi:hypothetical protein
MKLRLSSIRALHRLNALAPIAAIATLVGIAFVPGVTGSRIDRISVDARVREVEARLLETPFRLGDWVGTDEPLPAAALEILHSSAVLSRQYTNLRNGDRARLAIVYCGDARDMLGHHPPVCYPSSGWRPVTQLNDGPAGGTSPKVVAIQHAGEEILANLYRFTKADPSGVERQITIVGFFAIPGVGMTRDETSLRAQSGSRAQSSLGVGQVQVLLDGHPTLESVQGVARELLEALPTSTFRLLLDDPADKGISSLGSTALEGFSEGSFEGSSEASSEGSSDGLRANFVPELTGMFMVFGVGHRPSRSFVRFGGTW